MSTLLLIQNDTAPTLTGTVSADCTGATAVANIRRVSDRTVFTKGVDFTDPATGAWAVTWIDDDLSVVGSHYIEIEVTFANTKVQTFATDSNGSRVGFKVLAQIA